MPAARDDDFRIAGDEHVEVPMDARYMPRGAAHVPRDWHSITPEYRQGAFDPQRARLPP